MLVLTRKNGEGIWIGDTLIRIDITGRNSVKLAIDAPKDVKVMREELKKELAMTSRVNKANG